MQPMVVLKDIYQGYPILFGEPTSLKLEPAMEATEIPTSSIDHTWFFARSSIFLFFMFHPNCPLDLPFSVSFGRHPPSLSTVQQ